MCVGERIAGLSTERSVHGANVDKRLLSAVTIMHSRNDNRSCLLKKVLENKV